MLGCGLGGGTLLIPTGLTESLRDSAILNRPNLSVKRNPANAGYNFIWGFAPTPTSPSGLTGNPRFNKSESKESDFIVTVKND